MLKRSMLSLLTAGALIGCGGPLDESEPTSTTLESDAENESTEDDTTKTPDDGEESQETTNNDETNNDETNTNNDETNTNNDETNTNNDETNTNNSTTGDELRLTSFHTSVFVEKGCTSGYCHGGFELGNPQDVIGAFVDVEAPEPTCGRTHYVVPGNPEGSILWVRVRPITDEDVECEVVKMPKGSEVGLDEDAAQLIYDWISDGALL